jgi:hypothetical protein
MNTRLSALAGVTVKRAMTAGKLAAKNMGIIRIVYREMENVAVRSHDGRGHFTAK